jgi:hypothetical protein
MSQQNDKTAQQNAKVDRSNVPQQEDVFEHLFQHVSNAQQTTIQPLFSVETTQYRSQGAPRYSVSPRKAELPTPSY